MHISFQSKLFLTQIEVCEVVQQYIYVSKYNLKRSLLHVRNQLTFVCSCISKKPQRKNKHKEMSQSLKNNSSEMIESNVNENSKYILNNHRTKRHNDEACKFRLRFKYHTLRKGYLSLNTCHLIHNHVSECNANQVRITYHFI